ncbi:MAG: alpha/beta hydrolase [Phycisphaerae bacterium]|nr:alpha/beta hydrolase [Phycisphaerae bacterium]
MTRYHTRLTTTLALACGFLLAGCQQELMPTPNLYIGAKDNPFQAVPPALQSSRIEVIYATDRLPVQDKKAGLRYGHERSKSLAFGSCTVEIGRNLSWDDLVRESRTQRRGRSLPLNMAEISELGRFPSVPDLAGIHGATFEESPESVAKRSENERRLVALLSERLAKTPRHECYIYVHGFSNTFENAAFVMAGLWHFMGHTGVPIIYTWPAGSPEGALGGYSHDSESGQFTGYHLRQFLRTVASCPDLEKMHLIAHSRGTDVLTTALRELNLECRAAGKQTRSELKLGNVILAAADLDFEVTSQRITAELLPLVPERMTVYVSPTDRAIGVADVLFGSKRRIGQLRWDDLNPEQRKVLNAISQMQIVDARVNTGFLGHSYFHASPAVSSDVILLLRDNRDPGIENGRPLTRRGDSFWEIDDKYLAGPGK